MALINKDERQSVFDLLLEKTGAISGLFEFLNNNNLTDVDVPEGEYVMNDVVKKEVVNFFASISPEVSIATGTVTILDGTIIAQAKNSNGDVVATKTISLIDNVIEIPDSEISAGGVVLGGLAASTPLSVNIYDQNNNLITPISSDLMGGVATVKVNSSSASEWVRPASWPPLENKEPNHLYYLVEHVEGITQYLDIFIKNLVGTTNLPKFYINDIFIEDIPDNSAYRKKLQPASYINYGERYWFWIKIEVTNLSDIILYNNTLSPFLVLNVVELINTISHINSIHLDDAGAGYRVHKPYLKHYDCSSAVLNTQFGTFRSNRLDYISNFYLPNPDYPTGYPYFYATETGVVPTLVNATGYNLIENSFAYTIVNRVIIINSHNLVSISSSFLSSQVQVITFDDLENVTSAIAAFPYCYFLQKIILTNLKVSTNLDYCYSMTVSSLLETINSLADLNGLTSQSLTLTGIPNGNHADIISAANAKNWTIVY